jgi:GT2 family glycosyltransferase
MRSGRILVVIPVHGGHDMTHALLEDLRREAHLVDVAIVDNGHDYVPNGDETVLRPGENLGWAGGTNFGTTECLSPAHAAAVWMNNDTRLATGFVAGLVRAWEETGAGLIGPLYDCYWEHQRPSDAVEVSAYRPRARHYAAPFVDGTCMFVPVSTLEAIGMLDSETFAPVGYGADVDYALRVRSAGMPVAVTRLAYLHHEKSVTAQKIFAGGLEEYGSRGYPVMEEGMTRKWGEDWRSQAGIDPATSQTRPVRWRERLPAPPMVGVSLLSASIRRWRLSQRSVR